MDATFFENQPYYPNPSLQGEKLSEDCLWDFSTIPLPISTGSPNLSKPPTESIMPITTMENTETELGIGGDLPMLNHQPELHVYSRKAKHQAPQKVLVVTLQEHYQETELETNPKSEGVSGCEGVLGFPGNQQEDMLQQQNDLDLDLDMPIAVRKGIRSCTNYPISNYLSYSNLSSSYQAFK